MSTQPHTATTATLVPKPVRWKGRLVQYVGRIMRPYPGKLTAEVHDYHDAEKGVLAASLSGRAAGYVSLGFPDPRRIATAPSVGAPGDEVGTETRDTARHPIR